MLERTYEIRYKGYDINPGESEDNTNSIGQSTEVEQINE